uniref:NADH dehydrogenase subunit 6 n=1 Tax=Pseudosymplanella nigrifasciata TaxID=2886261 RepID=UPI001E7C4686|nr:NADH dehydrogenase subunit 6 [Pseudosymplanella nigrifasciata]UDL72068.1 NADH dehydrogenase subunit 6 [Pseudosymplanella nigrifasciata]
MLILMFTLSVITPLLNHPISLGFSLLFQTIFISINLMNSLESSWYSYILFITIIGGMMVMFMYMASISSNEKFEILSLKKMLLLTFMMIYLYILNKKIIYEMNTKMQEMKLIYQEFQEVKSTYKFFNMNKSKITIFMLMILLMTMISVTNISSSFEGPLKKTYV